MGFNWRIKDARGSVRENSAAQQAVGDRMQGAVGSGAAVANEELTILQLAEGA